jgi:hypothetical protein
VREDLGEQLLLPLHAWHRERAKAVFPVALPSGVSTASMG